MEKDFNRVGLGTDPTPGALDSDCSYSNDPDLTEVALTLLFPLSPSWWATPAPPGLILTRLSSATYSLPLFTLESLPPLDPRLITILPSLTFSWRPHPFFYPLSSPLPQLHFSPPPPLIPPYSLKPKYSLLHHQFRRFFMDRKG